LMVFISTVGSSNWNYMCMIRLPTGASIVDGPYSCQLSHGVSDDESSL
jgi:hypothetical protein